MPHHTELKGLKLYLPILTQCYYISINLQANFKEQSSTFDESTLPSNQQYHLQTSYSKKSSSKLIILDSSSNLFPDQIHYHSLELNVKFCTYEMSPGQRINSFQSS